MRKLNIAELEMQYDEDDPEGYTVGYNRFGPSIEAVRRTPRPRDGEVDGMCALAIHEA